MAQPHTTRRDLAGASFAMLLLGAHEAGANKAAELDRDLIHWAGQMVATDRILLAYDTLADPFTPADTAALEDASGAWNEAYAAALPLRPRTPEGLRAKFAAFITVLRYAEEVDGPAQEWGAMLASDVLGEARP